GGAPAPVSSPSLLRTSAHSRSATALPRQHATRRGPRRQPEHARNQVGGAAADAAAARGGTQLGRGAEGSGTKAARPTLDAARDARQDRSPLPAAGDDPRGAGAAVIPIGARVRDAARSDRA